MLQISTGLLSLLCILLQTTFSWIYWHQTSYSMCELFHVKQQQNLKLTKLDCHSKDKVITNKARVGVVSSGDTCWVELRSWKWYRSGSHTPHSESGENIEQTSYLGENYKLLLFRAYHNIYNVLISKRAAFEREWNIYATVSLSKHWQFGNIRNEFYLSLS